MLAIVLAIYLGGYVLAFLGQIRTVVYVLVGAVFFAYLIYPLVSRLRARMPLGVAILVVYALILVALAAFGVFLVPHVLVDVGEAVRHYPDLSQRLDSVLNDPSDPLFARIPDWLRAEIIKLPKEALAWLRVNGLPTFGHAIFLLAGTFAAFATFVIVPLMTAYLLLDLDDLSRFFMRMIPPARRTATAQLFADLDAVVGGFIRGQLLVALAVGILITIALLILHVRYAFLLGLIAAIGDLIPYVGAIAAFVPSFFTALFNNGWVNALIVAGVFLAIFQVEGHIIAPNIVSKTVNLSPFVVLVALLVGGELGGLVGLLLAVPVAGMLRVLVLRVLRPGEANHPAS
jgi:predicted PurR-regulated permease PerM